MLRVSLAPVQKRNKNFVSGGLFRVFHFRECFHRKVHAVLARKHTAKASELRFESKNCIRNPGSFVGRENKGEALDLSAAVSKPGFGRLHSQTALFRMCAASSLCRGALLQ